MGGNSSVIGKRINDYTIIEYKGKGSFASVYVCKRGEGIYAIKIFNADYVFAEYNKNPNDNRVTREIEILKRVNHPNVIKYIDDGRFIDNGNEYIFVVMDYADGIDLKSYLEKKTLTIEEALSIFKELIKALDAIHNEDIVHRDLKPENIYITKENGIKILDFGLSKLIDFTSITSTGTEIGSPLYMSPEQVADGKNIDYRSDYYALGIILYQMLTKRHPYGIINSKHELYYKILNEPPVSISTYFPTIPNNIDNMIDQLLQKKNYLRPNNADIIIQYIESKEEAQKKAKKTFLPTFYLRVWNEKTILMDFYNDGYKVEKIIFPINHQKQQKNLLKHIKETKTSFFIDPSTLRLAYDAYSEVKGLIELPYAPDDLTRLELNDLQSITSKREYVKKVVDEQLKHTNEYIVSPFHVSNNSNLVKIKTSEEENWFSLDIKLLKETKDYLKNINLKAELIGGFCVRTEIITTKTEKEYFLNVLSG